MTTSDRHAAANQHLDRIARLLAEGWDRRLESCKDDDHEQARANEFRDAIARLIPSDMQCPTHKNSI